MGAFPKAEFREQYARMCARAQGERSPPSLFTAPFANGHEQNEEMEKAEP